MILAIYLIIVNISAFIMYAVDKQKSKKGSWRISEKTLLGVAFIGGSIGAWYAMYLFRHKTKHWQFVVGVPAILLLQLLAAYLLLKQ